MEEIKLTYNQAVQKLDELVKKMQSPECDIDQLSAYTTEALQLLKYCKDKLTKTDEQVKKALADING